VVVGARLAGCATAIPLARAGHRVVAIDRDRFPSNTLSTHGLFQGHLVELRRLGALDRLLALDPPKIRRFHVYHLGQHAVETAHAVDGIDYGLCIGREELDLALVESAREAGVEVRERTSATSLLWEDGRAAGIRYRSRDGDEGEIRAPLVVGADGRRSTVARLVGADVPYRGSRNGRGFVWWYLDDPKLGTRWRETLTLWQIGETHVMTAPMPHGRMIVILMGPAEDVPLFRTDPRAMWERVLREHRHLADRVAGAGAPGKPFTSREMPAFFRASSGSGWALAGDAGHYKDATIGQGIRDSLEWGRRLGEAAAPVLRDAPRLDEALARWERARDRAVLPTYHWANMQSRIVLRQPIAVEALRTFDRSCGPELGDVLSRVRTPQQVFSPLRGMVWMARALRRPGAERRTILGNLVQESLVQTHARRERLSNRFRPARRSASETPGWTWPPRTQASGPKAVPSASEPVGARESEAA
jgi:2-polyprenyl-6-methoxyphenol hydroxylase-like FAD-dependent oxidoreductase